MQKKEYKNYSQQNAQNETMLQYTRWDLRTALANLLTILIKEKGFLYYVFIHLGFTLQETGNFRRELILKLAPLKTYIPHLVDVYGSILMLDWVKDVSASEGNGCK